MSDKKDYAKWTFEDLLKEEKKMKKNEIISAVIIGFLAGIMIFGVANNGFGFSYVVIPVLLILGIVKNSQNHKQKLKDLRTEITARNID